MAESKNGKAAEVALDKLTAAKVLTHACMRASRDIDVW